ncbi:MAG TPA: tRNA (adenosine(37)-N6)-dimethylallyltransferase MiaA [Polyangiales bacterium]|nr:tRNA (adenosine(37)-N6)-dimethylallyltransferase MiaA [Polyangiales bacterium]
MSAQSAQGRVQAPIVALVGPTGVGKTAVAVGLCEQLGGEIIGADSVQVYRGFDIGANKPSAEDLRGVRHHLLDVLAPDEEIDAARFARLADATIAEVSARGGLAVVVGGTGLWLRALLRGLVELPPVDAALRARLEGEWDERGAELMHARLREVDPRSASHVHPSDRLRVVRALEVHVQTGHALGELRAAHALGAPRYPAHVIALDLPVPHWRNAIALRTRAMFARGFVAEVQGLVARYGQGARALRAVGYRQVAEGLAAEQAPAEIERQVLVATHTYGRRQRTWFRSDPSVSERLAPNEVLTANVVERVRAWVQGAR